MKKIILSAAILASSLFASAQDATTTDYKPSKGAKTIEVNFAPLSGGSLINMSYLRGRYFIADKMALRAGIQVAFTSNTLPLPAGVVVGSGGVTAASASANSFDVAIIPGLEKHFTSWERLSPYIGAELLFGLSTASRISSITDASGISSSETVGFNGIKEGGINLGLNAVLGADYYFTKRVYLGLELGYGFTFKSKADIKTTNISSTGSTITTTLGGNSIYFGPSVNSSLRLGFWF